MSSKVTLNDEGKTLLRFLIVGGTGTIIAWLLYNLLYLILPFNPKEVWAYCIGFILAVIQQHALHRLYTFRSNDESYFQELGRAYAAYSFGMIISAALHYQLTQEVGIHHQYSWVISTGVSEMINFLCLKYFVFIKDIESHSSVNSQSDE